MTSNEVPSLLQAFRDNRAEFQRLVTAASTRTATASTGAWGVREIVIHMAAWLDEATDRIPRIMAGAPSVGYAIDDFNAEALAHAQHWNLDQALGAFRRAADRFDVMIAESVAEELADEPDVRRWLATLAGTSMNDHFADLARLGSSHSRGIGHG